MGRQLLLISTLLTAAIALSATGLVRVFHLETAHADEAACVVEDGCQGQTADPEQPVPSDSDEDCPDCHMLTPSARAMIIWTIATIVLDAPAPARAVIEQQRIAERPIDRRHPARGPPMSA